MSNPTRENQVSQDEELSFEQALEQLRTVVMKLEQGEGKLDEALEAYALGTKLKTICERRLAEAKERIELINADADKALSTQPFDPAS